MDLRGRLLPGAKWPHLGHAHPAVLEAATVLKQMNATVTVRFYPGMGHMVSTEEVASVREIVEAI